MKNFKNYMSLVAIVALLFTSCSKDEHVSIDSEKATLSFGAIVNDLATNRAPSKQSVGDIPECSDDTPAYVRIVLMQGGTEILGTTGEPYRVNLAQGQLFTVEDPNLELTPGNYTLDHFAVYNSDDELIWIAPRVGGVLEGFVNNALPLAIDLRAGVKKYVEVSVLCFDNRDVNEYGYLFFELDTNQAVTFCFFANYCAPDGRHYPANYSVSVWRGTNASGTPIYTSVNNQTGQYDNGDYYATPLCLALPTNDDLDEDYLYYQVTLLDWPAVYGSAPANSVISGTLSMNDIMNNFDGDDDVDYEHLRFGCGDDDGGVDPVDPEPTDCLPVPGDDCSRLSFEATVNTTGFPVGSAPFYPLTVGATEVGTITFNLAESGADRMTVSIDLFEGYSVNDVEVSLPEFVDTQICVQNIDENDFEVVYIVDTTNFPAGIDFPVQVEFDANICDED